MTVRTGTTQTFVSGLWDLERREHLGRRTVEEYRALAAPVLDLDAQLVVFADPELVDWLAEERRRRGLAQRTRVIARSLEDLPHHGLGQATADLPTYRNDEKTGTWTYNVLQWSKLSLVVEVAHDDPSTDHFAWIDLGLSHVAVEPLSFPGPSDDVAVLQMRPVAPRELTDAAEFYSYERGRIAAGLIRADRAHFEELAAAFDAELVRALGLGVRPNEQMVLAALTVRRPELFSYYYGDYSSVLCNWDAIRDGVDVALMHVEHCRAWGLREQGAAVSQALLDSLAEGHLVIGPSTTERLLRTVLGAAWAADELGVAERAAGMLGKELGRRPGASTRHRILASLDLLDPPGLPRPPHVEGRAPAPEPPSRSDPPRPRWWAADPPSRSRPTIALCMIVRDEAAVLPRCVASVRGLIDAWVVCDTGSEDGTPELLGELLGDLPGQLHHRPWRDFGSNRTELLELARGQADYLLLLDADHSVELTSPLPDLVADEYHLLQREGIEHWLPRLVRADLPWRYVGTTHEHLACDAPVERAELDGLVVIHHADGGSRGPKLHRDRQLLEATLRERPDDQRATFYLAQTLEGQGQTDEAIRLYRRRAALGGWEEEVYVARLRAAELLADRDLDAGLRELWDVWRSRPQRAEALLAVARRANRHERHEDALSAAMAGEDLPPCDDILFVDPAARTWGLPFERSLALGRLGQTSDAIELTDQLLDDPARPAWLQAEVALHRQACSDELSSLGQPGAAPHAQMPMLLDLLGGDGDLVGLDVEVSEPWRSLNPSVAMHDGELAVVVRTVNYQLRADGSYDIADPEGVVRTRNHLVVHDDTGAELTRTQLTEPDRPARFPSPVRGLEDLRLFMWRGSWHVIGTSRELDPTTRCRMAVARIDGSDLTDLTALPDLDRLRPEKNWMPLVDGDRLRFVYSLHPLVVLEWDPQNAVLREVVRSPGATALEGLRGGSQAIRVDEGWLLIGHTVVETESRRLYRHRFVLLDDDLQACSWSEPFSFERYGVELCAGLAQRGDDLLISYGVEDRAARLMAVSRSAVLDLLGT